MKVACFLNIVSPHQMPLAREIAARVGAENFRYVHAEALHAERSEMGWNDADLPEWCKPGDESAPELFEADLLYTGLRCFDLLERRAAAGRKSFYYSERWFKPIPFLKLFGREFPLPGRLRMLHPGYRRMVRRFVRWANAGSGVRVLAVGPWARGDFISMGVDEARIADWGYFVAPGDPSRRARERAKESPSLLYIGRLLALKHVETIVRALKRFRLVSGPATLTIVGDGPEAARLHRLVDRLFRPADGAVAFRHSVPISEVRAIMREHSALVFASNGFDGWGAVVSEALEEGVPAIGTCETGASAALLPPEQLFHCGDVDGLVKCIRHVLSAPPGAVVASIPHEYTAKGAAEKLLAL